MDSASRAYSFGKRIHTTVSVELYEGTRVSDGLEVVLKRFLSSPAGAVLPLAKRELDVLRRVAGPGVPRALELYLADEEPLLVLERISADSLEGILQDGPMRHEDWLDLAIRLAETLERVHAARMMHLDITPSTVFIAHGSRGAWIVDFGSARELGSSSGAIRTTGTVKHALAYIAPEQTGRMNRGCDYRSDLYSLGATLYTALAGRPPFVSSDPLELIHAHIARTAPMASAIQPGLPEAFSAVLAKLLEKEPEDRYQSAGALRLDLASFRDQIARSGAPEADFVLARTDSHARPVFSRRLHGRDRETAYLRDAYARSQVGEAMLVVISGEPGSGKSALVDELRKTLARSSGYVVDGKFDHYRDHAYGGWVNALDALTQQVLVESDHNLDRWRREVVEGVGGIARALVDLVPDLGLVLGDLPPTPVLGARETQARLALALRRFVNVFATPAHPLVLFLDDLQWSDAGSLRLLEEVLRHCRSAALLVICAYRSNEVGAPHPLLEMLGRLEENGVPAESLALGPIGVEATASMLADALDCTRQRVARLAEIVGRKTGHSPLLVRQLVDLAYENGWLRWELDRGWVWNSAELEASRASEGAVTLLQARMNLLAPASRALIEFASFVGDEFDADQLSELSGQTRAELEIPLHALAADGLIVPSLRGFRFAHDRIREAAQQFVSEAERAERHYRVGRLLLESIPVAEQSHRALDIVEHLNRGRCHVPEELRLTLIELDYNAGSAVLAKGAASTARDLLAVGRELFTEDDWRAHEALGFELHLAGAEAEFQSQNFEVALALLDALDRRALSRLAFTRVAVKRSQILALTSDVTNCARYGLAVLRKLGIRWPLHPSRLRVRLAVWIVRMMLRGRSVDAILRPGDFDPGRFCPLLLLPVTGASFLRFDVGLTLLSVCLAMRRYIRFGFMGRPGFLVANYAVFSYLLERNAQRALRDVETALGWCARLPDPVYQTRTELIISAGLQPWLRPRRKALAPLPRISEEAREIGDPEFSYYARFLSLTGLALAGESVSGVARALEELVDDVHRGGYRYLEPDGVCAVYRLLETGSSESELEAEVEKTEKWIREQPDSAETYVRTIWMLVLCVHGRYDLALQQSDALGEALHRIVPFSHVADHTFYRGLACAVLAGARRGRTRRRLRASLRDALRRLRRWSRDGPDFLHMEALLEAENSRLGGDLQRARALYDHAARRAREQEFVHHAALAQERRADLLRSERRETEAAEALRRASALYAEWGALFKVALLSESGDTAPD